MELRPPDPSVHRPAAAVNVPINSQLMTWNASSPPQDVMQIWARWEQAHTVRTAVAVLGFGCELLAYGTSTRGRAVRPRAWGGLAPTGSPIARP